MAILPVYTFDHPLLRQVSKPVETFTDELSKFVKSMFETMNNADGIGLAANQVGDERAITVIDLSDVEEDKKQFNAKTPPMVLINPVITAYSPEVSDMEEGCLSLPTYRDTVTRPAQIQVRFYDVQMHEHNIEAEGLLARVMQHEIDHLSGKYFFDYLSPVRRAMAHPKLRRIQLGQAKADYPLYNPKTASKSRFSKGRT
ncbi:MAG: peptide deformylase [Candidatus Kapabacteria bacterium]|jgi:peptide deformylase|nr:peptide deformylase [Candidatus Kapabacteria bacterium]